MKKVLVILLVIIIILGGGCFFLYQYTDVFGKKIIPNSINSITIRYIPGYNLDAGEALNKEKECVKIQEIKLKDSDLIAVKKALRGIKKNSSQNKNKLVDKYEVVINNDIVLKINNEKSLLKSGKEEIVVKVPSNSLDLFSDYINKNNKKILKSIDFKNIVLKMEGSSITIKNKDNIGYIKDYLLYYPITLEADYKQYENGYKIDMVIDDKTHIYLYNSNIGYLISGDNKTYILFTEDLYSLLYDIYKVSTE